MIRMFFAVALVFGCACSLARADVIFKIEDVTVTPGDQVSIGVFAYATAGEGLDAYDLPVDVGNNGNNLPTGITQFGVVVTAIDTFGNLTKTAASLPFQDFDVFVSDDGNQITLPTSSNPRHLFDILVQTDFAFSGVTPVSISTAGSPSNPPMTIVTSAGTFTPSNLTGLQLISGSITAVPEPSALTVLGLLMGAGVYRRRR